MRISSIDFFRFLFMLQICFWHLDFCMGFMEHGYIAVEFFFILSGYFLYRSCVKQHALGVFEYTWDKLKRFFPEVLIVTIPTSILYSIAFEPDLIKIFNTFFFLNSTGIYRGGINGPLWYINVLLLGGGILYAFLYNYRRLAITIIFPLSVLLVYTYILEENRGSLELWDVKMFFYIPLWRGIAGLCLGCILARFHELKLQNPTYKVTKLLDILCCLSVVGSLVVVFTTSHFDCYALLFYCMIILCCFTRGTLVNKIFSHSIYTYLGQLSFEMMLVHMPISWILIKLYLIWNFPIIILMLLYLSLILICSVLLKNINKKFNRF